LLPNDVVDVCSEIDQSLEPVGAAEAADRDDSILGEHAPTERSIVGFGDAVEPMEQGSEATAGDAASGEDPRPGKVDGVGLVRAFGVDAVVDPPPSPASLAPAQCPARESAR
jgi:hypothetical protein